MAKATKAAKPKNEKKLPVTKKEKVIHLNFYQLGIVNSTNTSSDAEQIRGAFNSPPKPFSVLTREEDDARISLFERKLYIKDGQPKIKFGTLIHTQTRDLPFTSNDTDEQYEELKLLEGQGLGYTTSFLFDTESNILMIESVKNGVGVGVFCQFFEQNLSLENLDATILINPAQIDRYNKFNTFYKLHFKVARLQNGSAIKSEKNALGQLVSAADATNNDLMEITLSSGRKKDASLATEVVKGMVEGLLKYTSKEKKDVKKILVTGRDSSSGYSDEIDLIKDRVRDNIKVELVKTNTINAVQERYNALTSIYLNHKAALHKAYKID